MHNHDDLYELCILSSFLTVIMHTFCIRARYIRTSTRLSSSLAIMSTSLGEKSSLLENSFYSSDCVLSHPNARRLEESNQGASINPSRGTLREIFALIKGPERLWSVLFTSIVIALASLSFGYAFGFPSPTLLQLSDPNFIGNVSRADFQVNSKKDIFAVSYWKLRLCYNRQLNTLVIPCMAIHAELVHIQHNDLLVYMYA